MLGHARADAPLEHLPERGHADHGGDAPAREAHLEPLGRELVEVDDARSARQRQEHAAGELEGVMQRQHAEHAVALAEREERRERCDQRRQVRMGEHHALGMPRGPTGVDQRSDIVVPRSRRLAGLASGRALPEIEQRHSGDATPKPLRCGSVGEHQLGPRSAGEVLDHVRLHAGFERNGGRASEQDTEEGDGPGGMIRPGQEHAVALLDAMGAQTGGAGQGALAPLAEAQPRQPVGLGALQRNGEIEALGHLAEQRRQRGVALWRPLFAPNPLVDAGEHPFLQRRTVDFEEPLPPVDALGRPEDLLAIPGA